MKRLYLATIGLLLLACAVMPASAFTFKTLNVDVAPNGDARVHMTYDLSFVEQTAILLKMADPAAQLKSAFESGGARSVTVTEAGGSSATVIIPSFATVTKGPEKTTITTPALSFERAEAVLRSYWFAPLVSPDFSPGVATIAFPDGYKATYFDQISIPPVTRQVAG